MCGEPVVSEEFEQFKVTRREWTAVQDAIRAARLLAQVAEKHWPQVMVVREAIEEAQAVSEKVRDRMRYGPRPPKKK